MSTAMLMAQELARVAGAVGAAFIGADGYRIDLSDGTSRPATVAEVAAAAAAVARELIKAERDRRKGLGCLVGADRFHSDDASRIQQLGLVMMGAAMPAGIKWKVLGGGFVEMTPALAAQLFNAQAQRDMSLFAAAEQHIAAASAAVDPLAYDYSSGWPD